MRDAEKDTSGVILGTTFVLRLASSVLSIVIIGITVNILDANEPTTILVVELCSLAVIFNVFDSFNSWFQVQYKSKVTSIVTLIAYVVVSLYRVILLIVGKDVLWFAFASSIDYAVISGLLFWCYKKNKGPSLSFSLKEGKKLLGQGYHYILSGLMVTIYGQTDKLMLKNMLSETVVGYYSTATTICTAWVFVLQALIDSMFPSICRAYNEDFGQFEKKNKQLYATVFYISVLVSSFLTIGAEPIVSLLFGKDYLPAAGSLRIVTWYTAFAFIGVARNAWLVCLNKQKYEKLIYTIGAITNIVLNCFLIPVLGAEGAAFASLMTQVLTTILIPLFFKELRPNVKMILQAICLKGIK